MDTYISGSIKNIFHRNGETKNVNAELQSHAKFLIFSLIKAPNLYLNRMKETRFQHTFKMNPYKRWKTRKTNEAAVVEFN